MGDVDVGLVEKQASGMHQSLMFCVPFPLLQVAPSLDQLTRHGVGHCKAFEVESLLPATNSSAAATTPAGAANSSDASPREPVEVRLRAGGSKQEEDSPIR